MSLLTEIQTKCSSELIASRDHAAIAAAVNVGRTKTNKVPIADIQAYLQTNGLWWAIKAVAADSGHAAHDAAVAVLDVAGARYDNIDTTLPIVATMFGGLVSTSVMAQADADAIAALGVVPDHVSLIDVAQALENGA